MNYHKMGVLKLDFQEMRLGGKEASSGVVTALSTFTG